MSTLIGLAAYGAAALTFAVTPTNTDAAGRVVEEPRLLFAPTDSELAGLYPWAAFAQNRNGSSSMVCHVRRNRTLADCRLVGEGPDGAGFGRATLESAKYWRLLPRKVDGRETADGEVKLTIDWRVEP